MASLCCIPPKCSASWIDRKIEASDIARTIPTYRTIPCHRLLLCISAFWFPLFVPSTCHFPHNHVAMEWNIIHRSQWPIPRNWIELVIYPNLGNCNLFCGMTRKKGSVRVLLSTSIRVQMSRKEFLALHRAIIFR